MILFLSKGAGKKGADTEANVAIHVAKYSGNLLREKIKSRSRNFCEKLCDADLENIPFADSMYNHGGVPSNRPLLLIEPSYKINGEDRTKGRSSRSAG